MILMDFVFSYNTSDSNSEYRPFMMLDAKFIPKWKRNLYSSEARLGFASDFSSDSVWGDYNKCLRDMLSISGSATGVIFPVKGCDVKNEEKIIDHKLFKANNYHFFTVPLIVPEPQHNDSGNKVKKANYNLWKKEFENNLKEMLEITNECIDIAVKTHRDMFLVKF